MIDISAVRLSTAGDEAALREIWKVAFGDNDDFIDRFMSEVYEYGMASVAERDGEVVSAIYLFRDTELIMPDGKAIPAPYCYTLGTLREHRGHGLGAAVSEHIMQKAMRGAPMVALVPAESSLYDWYAETFGLYPMSEARKINRLSSELPPVPEDSRVHRVDDGSYGRLRELLLKGHCHVKFSPKLLKWYNNYIRADGGGLYLIDLAGDVGCAACEPRNGSLQVKELLLPNGDPLAALSLLAEEMRCDSVTALSPVFFPGEGKIRDFAVARARDSIALPEKSSIWWGLAFD